MEYERGDPFQHSQVIWWRPSEGELLLVVCLLAGLSVSRVSSRFAAVLAVRGGGFNNSSVVCKVVSFVAHVGHTVRLPTML